MIQAKSKLCFISGKVESALAAVLVRKYRQQTKQIWFGLSTEYGGRLTRMKQHILTMFNLFNGQC